MKKQSYYLKDTKNETFFVGYDIADSDVRFYHCPSIARKLSKEKAEELRDGLPQLYPSVQKHKLKVVPVQEKTISGKIFTYFLFDDRLLIVRRQHREAETLWSEFYNSDKPATDLWLDLTEDDRANGRVEFIMPEHLGALTDAPILGFDTMWNEDGEGIELTADSRIYWFPDYQIMNEFEKLDEKRHVSFERAELEPVNT